MEILLQVIGWYILGVFLARLLNLLLYKLDSGYKPFPGLWFVPVIPIVIFILIIIGKLCKRIVMNIELRIGISAWFNGNNWKSYN